MAAVVSQFEPFASRSRCGRVFADGRHLVQFRPPVEVKQLHPSDGGSS
jgi:hypothetical protein